MDIILRPIGFVKNQLEKGPLKDYENLESEIIIEPSFTDGLHLLDENSHIMVVFWLDRTNDSDRKTLKLHPKGREDLPLTGIFATRSPRRPNPIGLRAVKLLKKKENILIVEGLDAFNGTPVLDIKPYSSKHDLVENSKHPWWIDRFSKEK
jgi:tRNA-Thr(GGU) m(6)t(6)A37 methyltransferase TsaA